MTDDEGQYWAQMQAEAVAAEAEASMAAEAEYRQQMEEYEARPRVLMNGQVWDVVEQLTLGSKEWFALERKEMNHVDKMCIPLSWFTDKTDPTPQE